MVALPPCAGDAGDDAPGGPERHAAQLPGRGLLPARQGALRGSRATGHDCRADWTHACCMRGRLTCPGDTLHSPALAEGMGSLPCVPGKRGAPRAATLHAQPDVGLFYFDTSYRPCPLAQQYVGITVKKPLQRFQLMNEICYNKVLRGRLHATRPQCLFCAPGRVL